MANELPPEKPIEQPPAGEPLYIESTSDDRNLAMLAHLLGGLFRWPVPLIIWLIKKDQSKFVDDQGKEALNFQLTLVIAHLVCSPFCCIPFVNIVAGVCHGVFWILSIVFGIIGGMAAQKGEVYRYPVAIRMIK